MAKVGDKTSKGVVKSTRKGVAVAYKGDGVSSSSRGGGSKKTGDPRVDAINAAREANVEAGRSAYSGAGATALSASKGKGGYDPDKSYSDLPDFAKEPAQQAPVSPTAAPTATTGVSGAINAPMGVTAPVATPAATPTPTQNRYQTGLAAAQAGGVAAPADAGVARATASSYLPAQQQDTSVVDNIFSQDPVIGQLMGGIADLLSSKNQVPSIMEDYKKLRKQSGLDDINEELIDAETILDGTEDDIRNEIQTAGGFGTESQVQAMTLSRNKNLLKRYNQLVQMKTDATNQLNTMLTLTQQDRQMAQERVNTQISAMFNMANFRQTALQNTRSQQQFMIQTMGADGYYATVSKDPRQLAMAEQIMGVAPGGLQAVAAQAAQEKARKAAIEERQIRATESNAAVAWANLKYQKEKDAAAAAVTASGQSPEAQVTFLKNTVAAARDLSGGAGQSGVTRFLGNLLVGDTKRNRLQSQVETLKSNMLTLAADPNIKKFFGPQMSDNDVKAMQAAGTTLNVDNMSASDLRTELDRLDAIFNKLEGATNYDPSGGAWIVQ